MKLTVVLFLISAGLLVSSACKKNPADKPSTPEEPKKPEWSKPVLYRPDSIRENVPLPPRFFNYSTNNQLKEVRAGIERNEYKYDDAGNVIEILLASSPGSEYNSSINLKISYKNGLPFSAVKHYDPPFSSKDFNRYYEIDTVKYSLIGGRVTQISYTNKIRFYSDKRQEKQLGTINYTILYDRDNWSGVIDNSTGDTIRKMTYGGKNGVFSAFPLKYVLFERDNAMYYSKNDLLSQSNLLYSTRLERFEYDYDVSNFPRRAKVNRENYGGKLDTLTQTYLYK